MQVFLITLFVSIVETIVFWWFGLAQKVWPAHPMIAFTAIVAVSAMVIQMLLSEHSRSGKSTLQR